MRIVALAGLPGTGKSTLARALSRELDAPCLDKDVLRDELFGPLGVEYSVAQDDHCFRAQLAVIAWLASRRRFESVIVDGRTFSRRASVAELVHFAADAGLALAWIECSAGPEVARARLIASSSARAHPALNRTPMLYDEIRARAEDLEVVRLVLETDRLSLETCLARCRAFLEVSRT